MAHLRDLDRQCQQPGCTARAVVELRDRWNSLMGVYCRSHGVAREKDLHARETHGFDVV